MGNELVEKFAITFKNGLVTFPFRGKGLLEKIRILLG
jgi:hypothetical protein